MIVASEADRLELLGFAIRLRLRLSGNFARRCALMSSKRLWLEQVEEAALGMAVRRFD